MADDEQRGILLHFFANHELLATELMALALLKFPDAPKAFRSGLLQTLKEEQWHTKWYMKRMEECGVRFGDFPVSGFFWDMVAPMESPLDYVSRLSLTFEQANLDYSLYYSGIMKQWGDDKTAAILKKIYEDEIGHVGYGLNWLRKWKREDEDDWTAYSKQLHFPMSPIRAKGNGAPFNEVGRRQAGLDEDFIRRVRLFERSRGRTPNVFFFNPNAENALASGGSKSSAVKDLELDLEIVSAFLARRDDVVLVRELPTFEHLERLRDIGFVLPEFEEISEDGTLVEGSQIAERKLNELRPWGWCPESAQLMRKLQKRTGTRVETARLLNSKSWSAELAGVRICRSLDEIRELAVEPLVVKAPLAMSGKGNRIWAEENARWVTRLLAIQKEVVVEPWHADRLFDFSVQYEMSARDGLRRIGFVRLVNTEGGQFRAVEFGVKFLEGVCPEVARFLMERPAARMACYDEELRETLEARFREAGYEGPVGVDAFVYRDAADGEMRLRRVAEINARYTMGRLVVELARKFSDGKGVRLEIVQKGDALPEGGIVLNDAGKARRFLGVMRFF
jgi:uncharacterized ferritin-like protein (DUF455 family)